jgi:hypothetical protein
VPLFEGSAAFHEALAPWGIEKIYAGSAAAHILGDKKAAYVNKFIKGAKKLDRVDLKKPGPQAERAKGAFINLLVASFKNSRMSIFLANDVPAIYFLTDADSYLLFRSLGTNLPFDRARRVVFNCLQSFAMKDLPFIGDIKKYPEHRLSFENISLAVAHLRVCEMSCEKRFLEKKGYVPDPNDYRYIEEMDL